MNRRINSKNSPASDASKVKETSFMSQVVKMRVDQWNPAVGAAEIPVLTQ